MDNEAPDYAGRAWVSDVVRGDGAAGAAEGSDSRAARAAGGEATTHRLTARSGGSGGLSSKARREGGEMRDERRDEGEWRMENGVRMEEGGEMALGALRAEPLGAASR